MIGARLRLMGQLTAYTKLVPFLFPVAFVCSHFVFRTCRVSPV